ncbi:MAG: polyprenyl synthetase family protein [Chloroflexia bacterium]|nr:polyprenyl synthetase family protein [Chloroflexia bacterium]
MPVTPTTTTADRVAIPSENGGDVMFILDRLLDPELEAAVAALDGEAPLLVHMARYHLGWNDGSGDPSSAEERGMAQGKRLRPALAFRCCAAAGGEPEKAAPLAAAVELLHNFTLIHDDIQDRSPNRRHRATVWRVWGDAQAINAGDALFAAAHLALFRLARRSIPEATVLRLAAAFDRMTIEIVRGQVLDLNFEGRRDVAADQYLTMIRAKTAAIVRFAAWAGALVGGAEEAMAERLGEFGEALGVGFQIRDDMLGIWGARAATGKDAADDIRRRKQTLPILLLRQAVSAEEQAALDDIYTRDEIDESGVGAVLDLLARHGIERQVAGQVAAAHDRAADSLQTALAGRHNETEAAGGLRALVDQLSTREG